MLIYEVSLEVDPAIASQVAAWLEQHLEDMVALEPIQEARLFRSTEEPDRQVVFVAHYLMRSRADYEDYLANHAARMRADGIERFGGQFRASRRVLESFDV